MPFITGTIALVAFLLKASAGIAIIALAVITFKHVVNWFQQRKKLKESDKNNIAFTIKQELDNGNYTVCQGIFNTETEELLDAQKWEGKIDPELANLHQDKPLVIYN